MSSEPEDPDLPTVASDASPAETLVLDPLEMGAGGLATSARRVLAARAPEPDPTHIGRFQILRRIGAGGMGVVYAAHDDELDRDVAIKLLRTNLAVDLSGRERLMREAQAIARLSHPNIVHVYEVGNDGDRVFMAMELIRGATLRTYCKGKTWREIVDVFIGAGEGLAAAHAESIVHRDFKPDNVIVDDHGRARVVDFGLARAPAMGPDVEAAPTEELGPAVPTPTTGRRGISVDLTGAGTVLGTPAYMAPEQLAKADPDARTDQFAFCVSLYEMLYDRRPFKGSTYTEVARAVLTGLQVDADAGTRGVPRSVRAVIMRGLSRAAEARFPTMDALLAALRKARAPSQLRVVGYLAAAAATGAVLVKLSAATDPPVADEAGATTPAAPTTTPSDPWAEIVAASDLPPLVPTPLAGDPTGVTVHRLRNGLTVYVAPRPMEPKVSVTVAVRAGSDQERAWGPGLAFFVMNSVYRGTTRLGVRDAALEGPALATQHALLDGLSGLDDDTRTLRLIATHAAELAAAPYSLPTDLNDALEAIGGDLYGSRTGSGTTYALTVPAVRVEGTLALIAEAVARPAFRDALSTVRDQLDRYTSLTENDLGWQTVQQELAVATGLREDYGGATAYMRTFPFADARALHDTLYRPNNTAVVVVGDVTPEAAIALCERHFGAWQPQTIPTRPPVDEALPGGVVRREIEDGGAPAAFVAWPLPPTDSPEYPAFLSLADALNRQDGLGSTLRATTGGASWSLSAYRSLEVRATALPDQSLEQVEAEIDRALDAVADDAIDDDAWATALARAELVRLRWAREAENLAGVVASSFIDRRPWADVAAGLSALPTRAEIVAAAKALRARSRVVVHRQPGKTWSLPVVHLPGARLPERRGGRSPFARAIVDAPIAPPEPRFLVAGSHYTVRPRDAARFIGAEQPGPLAVASWVYPIGVDDDPFVCDAVRARIWAVRIAGMDFDAYCANDFVWVDVAAGAERFEREASLAFDWLDHGMPSDSELQAHIDRTLHNRRSRRGSATSRNPAFHRWALRGDEGIHAHMPTDVELRRGGPAALARSLRRLDARAADVLYAGPGVERIAALVPPAVGRAAPPRVAARTRSTQGSVVYVLHDPDRTDAEVRVSVPWPDLDPRTSLAAQVHDLAVGERNDDIPASLTHRWVSTPWWATVHPLAFDVEYVAPSADVGLAVRTGIDVLRREVPATELEDGRRQLEISFRAYRPEVRRIPEVVRLWPTETDPRVAQWLALPSLEAADMRRFYEAFTRQPVIVSIVADTDTLDLAALAEHGTVIAMGANSVAEIVRDPDASE